MSIVTRDMTASIRIGPVSRQEYDLPMNAAPHPGVLVRVKRVTLTCVMVVLTLNIWTGGPLLALWIGSQAQGEGPPTMSAVAVAAVSLGVISYVLVRLLARVDAMHTRMTGRPSTV